MRRWGAFSAAFSAVLLMSCGSNSRPASGPAAESYFPMVDGTRWRYAISTELGSLEVEVTARGAETLPGEDLVVFLMDERNLGPNLGFDEVAPVGYLVEEGYVARIEGLGYDAAGKLRKLGQDRATRLLPVDPQPGDAWGQSNRLFGTPEGGGAKMGWYGDVRERTRVSVPAGTFDDVVEVVTTYFDESRESQQPRAVYHDFYARGIGLVKSVTEDPSGPAGARVEQVLLDYRFPGP